MSTSHPPVADFATDFDHTDPEWVKRPVPDLGRAPRRRCPVAHTDRYGGAWLPVRHDDVAAVAYDTEHFTSRSRGHERAAARATTTCPRRSASRLRSPRTRRSTRWPAGCSFPRSRPKPIAALEPFTRELCRELLDATAGRPTFDAAVDYAQHIPLRVIVEMLGFPQEDADIFRRFIHMIIEDVDMSAEEREAHPRSRRARRRTSTRGSTSTSNTRATTSRRSCSKPSSTARSSMPDHVRGTMVLLMVAGIDTTWSAIGASLWHLATHPEDRKRLVARARADADRGRGVPARVRAGHDGPHGGEGLRVRRLPDAGRATGCSCPFPAANRDPEVVRRRRRGDHRPGREPPRRVRPRHPPLPRFEPGADGADRSRSRSGSSATRTSSSRTRTRSRGRPVRYAGRARSRSAFSDPRSHLERADSPVAIRRPRRPAPRTGRCRGGRRRRRPRAAPRGCPARRSGRAPSRGSCRRRGSSTAGARSRSSCGSSAARPSPAGSAPRCGCRPSWSPRRGSGSSGSARNARAIVSSCFSPALTRAAFVVDDRVVAVRGASARTGRRRWRARPSRICSSVASRLPYAMFSRIVPPNSQVSWSTMPMFERRSRRRIFEMSMPSRRDRAVVERRRSA